MEHNNNDILTIMLKIKRLADIFERIEIAPKKQSSSDGTQATTEKQFYTDKELLNDKETGIIEHLG